MQRVKVDSARGRGVWIREDGVVKIQEPAASRRERLRTMAGREVGRGSGLFIVPEIVSFDDARGEIVFQRLQMTEVRLALSDPGRSMELVGRAATALAAIHSHMRLDEGGGARPRGGLVAGGDRATVPLHGDFAIINVLHAPASDSIVIIDWANADWIGVDADFGAPEIDLAIFLISLFHRRVFDPMPYARRHELARHFLATYSSTSPYGVDLGHLSSIVAAVTPGFHRLTQRLKGRLVALGHRHGMVDLRFFLRRLSGEGIDGGR